MNQTEFLTVKKQEKGDGNKYIKLIIIIAVSVAMLAVIFFISFSFTYSKIAKNRQENGKYEEKIREKEDEIKRLQKIIADKDAKIETLEQQIVQYEELVTDLEEREKYAREIAEELKKLPKDKVRIVYVPVEPTPQPSDSDMSDVQRDLYQKPAVIGQ